MKLNAFLIILFKYRFWVSLVSICLFCDFSHPLLAQKPKYPIYQKIDSLENLLVKAKNYERVDLLNELCWEYKFFNLAKAQDYGNKALSLAEKLHYKKGTAKALDNIGVVKSNAGKYADALEYFSQSLKIYNMTRDESGSGTVLNHAGMVYFLEGNYPQALKNLYESLKRFEKKFDYKGISTVLNNLGLVYKEQGNYEQALNYYRQSLSYSRSLKDERAAAYILNNLGLLNYEKEDYQQALKFYQESLSVLEKLNDKKGSANAYNNLGEVHQKLKNYTKAMEYYRQSYQLKEELADKEGLSSTLNNLAKINFQINNPLKAIELANTSFKIASELGAKARMRDASRILTEIYTGQNDFKNAFHFQQLYTSLKDSVWNEEKLRQITEIQSRYETENKDKENKLLRTQKELLEKDKELSTLRLNRNRNLIYVLVIFSILAFLTLIFLILLIRTRRKDNEKLEAKIQERTKHIAKIVKQLERANTEMDTFLYKASHDLKGPLATLEGLGTLGLMEVKDENAQNYFKMQKNVIDNMQLLIFRIIEIGDIRNHKIRKTEINLQRFAKRMVRSMNRVEGFNMIDFSIEIDEDMPVFADAEMLDIVLDNLIKNAIQHAKHYNTHEKATVTIKAEEGEISHDIYVIDNGNGINADIADKIFDMFFRGTDYFKGFGLGLYKAKISIEKLNGEIRLFKSNEQETVFKISIPKEER